MSYYSKIKVNDVVTDGEETFLVTRIDEGKYLSGIDKNGELSIYDNANIKYCSDCRPILHNHTDKPITNADRIRQMTDEELAQIIMCPYENMSGECMCEKDTRPNCIKCCLEWLRKEVEEKNE